MKPYDAQEYQKKPVVIWAAQLDKENGDRLARWCGGRTANEATDGSCSIDIPTLEGVMRADPGDWIIRGLKGEFYPCKPDIFEMSYERSSPDKGRS